MKQVSVSFLNSKKPNVDLFKLDKTSADLIHVDIMHRNFVKGKGVSVRDLIHIERWTRKKLDVHLMVNDAYKYLKKLVFLNVEYITVHLESKTNLEKTFKFIKKYGIKVGLAIKPNTSFEEVILYLEHIDLLLIMTVEPGFGGQPFITEMSEKISTAKKYIKDNNLDVLIEVDGGINLETKDLVKDADILVAGTYIINSYDFEESIKSLRQ